MGQSVSCADKRRGCLPAARPKRKQISFVEPPKEKATDGQQIPLPSIMLRMPFDMIKPLLRNYDSPEPFEKQSPPPVSKRKLKAVVRANTAAAKLRMNVSTAKQASKQIRFAERRRQRASVAVASVMCPGYKCGMAKAPTGPHTPTHQVHPSADSLPPQCKPGRRGG